MFFDVHHQEFVKPFHIFGTFLLLVVLVVQIIYLIFKYKFDYWPRRGFYYLKPQIPFGNLKEFCLMKEFYGDTYKKIYDALGNVRMGGIYQMTKPILVIKHPDEIKKILFTDFEYFHCRDETMDLSREVLGHDLFFTQDYNAWKLYRYKLSRHFTWKKITGMLTEIQSVTDKLLKCFDIRAPDSKTGIDINETISDYATDLSFSTLFGINTHLLETSLSENQEIRKAKSNIEIPEFITIFRCFLATISATLPVKLGVPIMPLRFSKLFVNLAKDLTQFRKSSLIRKDDLMNSIIHIEEDNDLITQKTKKFNTNFKIMRTAGQCFVFFAAGSETTSFIIASCIHALAHHPDIQKKLYQEITDAKIKHDNELTMEAYKKMEYLDMVVLETMRLCPPVADLVRQCTKEYITSEGLVIEPGTKVVIPIYALQRDPKYYPEPLKFKPERFTKDEIDKRHKYTYIPFGKGPRSCLGLKLGLTQVKISVVSLLMKYDIVADDRSPFPAQYSPKMFVSTINKDGFWVKLNKRNDFKDNN